MWKKRSGRLLFSMPSFNNLIACYEKTGRWHSWVGSCELHISLFANHVRLACQHHRSTSGVLFCLDFAPDINKSSTHCIYLDGGELCSFLNCSSERKLHVHQTCLGHWFIDRLLVSNGETEWVTYHEKHRYNNAHYNVDKLADGSITAGSSISALGTSLLGRK